MLPEEQKPEGGGGETSTPKTPEDVAPSGGDKPETTPAVEPKVETTPDVSKDDIINKQQEHINGLTTGLGQARDDIKEYKKKQGELEAIIGKDRETISKLEKVFTPPEPETPPEEVKGMTEEEVSAFWEKKDAERKKAEEKEKRAESIKAEIVEATKKWNGQDGKPLYKDEEVMAWQEENNKMYLRPEEAFREMKHADIIDYEVKQRMMSGNKPAPDAEQPSSQPAGHEGKETLPKTDQEVKAAALDAMNAAAAEM
jgi:hypothetical protein